MPRTRPSFRRSGMKPGAISEKTHFSRPAISHHIKVLKDAGIVGTRTEGKKNYYYLTNDNAKFNALLELFENVMDLADRINSEKREKPEA